MVRVVGNSALGPASAFGAPAIDGVDPAVLSFPAYGSTESLQILPESAGNPISSWALGLDLYVPQPAGSFVSLVQTGDGDGDIFLQDNGDGTAGVGISGVYDGNVAFDAWNRLVFTVTVEDDDTILRKFVNGSLVGEQNLGVTDRWSIDPATGLRLFTDNDGETAPGLVSSVFFTSAVPAATDVATLVASVPAPTAAGFFPSQPSDGAVELGFADDDLTVRYGEAAVLLEGAGFRTPVDVGDSAIAFASQFDIDGPGGADIPVLDYDAYTPSEGIAVGVPPIAGSLSSYTAVWDINFDALPGFQALLQTDASQSGDGELFIRGDGGLGINGDYDGAVTPGTWHRIAVTVEDRGDGSATLSKYLDGAFLDSQSVSAERFTLDPSTGFLLLTDNDRETSTGFLAHFGLSEEVLDAAAIAALGGPDGAGPFEESPAGSPSPLPDTGTGSRTLTLSFDSSFRPYDAMTGEVLVSVDGNEFQSLLTLDTANVPGGTSSLSRANETVELDFVVPESAQDVAFSFNLRDGGNDWWWAVDNIALADEAGNLIFAESFDGLTDSLMPAVDETVGTLGWTDTPPEGWTRDNAPTMPQGTTEWQGWSFATPDFWTSADGQNRTDFTKGTGVVAIADPDEWDDFNTGTVTGNDFDSTLTTPTIALEIPASPQTYQLGFDGYEAAAEFGFEVVDLQDDPPEQAIQDNINDLLLTDDGSAVEFDLAAIFGPGASSFAVAADDGSVVDAQIDGSTLTLSGMALGHSDITVTALTENGAPIEENFRAIVAGENAYVFAIIPDTQDYTSNPGIAETFGNMTDWLVEQKDALAIQHAIHVGDIVQFGAVGQWEIAEDAMERLDGELSYTLAIGNHDQQRPGFASAFSFETDVDTYFTPEQVGATPAQGGGLYDGFDVGEDTFGNGNTYSDSIRNHYTTLTTPDGTDWLIMSLEFGMPDDVLRWASEVIEDHLDHRVIIDTHSWNGGDGRVTPTTEPLNTDNDGWGYAIRENPRSVNGGEDAWRELASKYPNITFTFNGHNFMGGAETVVSYAAGDNPVHQMFVNYQNGAWGGVPGVGTNGGNGAMRLVVVDPDNDRITTHTKLVELDDYFEDFPDHQEVFEGVDVGTPEQIAIAKAGGTEIVAGDGIEATVSLDPGETLVPGATDPFTVAVIPDTQVYAYAFATRDNPQSTTPETAAAFPALAEFVTEPGIMQAQADWLIANAEELNLKLVTHVGDVTQGTLERDEAAPEDRAALPEHSLTEQWSYAEGVYGSLRDAGIPVALAIGNHDDSEDGYNHTPLWSASFGAESEFFAAEDGFLGFSDNDRNSARLIDIGDGKSVLHLSLDYLETEENQAERAAFAQAQIDANPGVPTIVTTHKNIDENGNFQASGQNLLDTVVTPNPQVELVVSGHYVVNDFFPALLENADGSAEQVVVTKNAAGEDVYHVVQNYQGGTPLDSGYIRLFEFDTIADTVTVSTYSPVNDEFRSGDEIAFGAEEPFPFGTTASFTLPIDLDGADGGVVFEWFAADGEKLGETDGAPLDVDLKTGAHRLTLKVTDQNGNVSTDEKVVIVEAPETLLTETFDDGDAAGWVAPESEADGFVDIGTDLGFSLPSIGGVAQIPLTLQFDSSFRPFDAMTGEVMVSFDDGQSFATLLTLDTATVPGGSSSLDRANEAVTLETLAPNSADSVQFAWRLSQADNDWWWAIDNVEVVGPEAEIVTEFWAEDFNGLATALQAAVDEDIPADVLGWTHTVPDGWERSVDAPQGTTEWQGWSFATPDFWLAADNQSRDEFAKGTGVVAIADGDEWDDFNTGSVSGDDFDTSLTTAAIDLTGQGTDAGDVDLRLSFDSSFRPYDAQTGEVLVSFDGGEFASLLTLDTSTVPGGASALSRANETVALDLVAPQGTESVQFRFDYLDADNDWWWAIDNLSLGKVETAAPTLLAENFDDLALQTVVDEVDPGFPVWTPTPPADWTQEVAPTTSQGSTEFQGWTFMEKEFWVSVSGNQDRDSFTLGQGNVAVADPDEWDDANGGAAGDTDEFDSTLTTPAIDLTDIGGGQPEGSEAGVLRVPALAGDQGILVTPTSSSGVIDTYTVVFDILLSETTQSFSALFQTDVTNSGDADIYFRNDGETASIGISGDYDGALRYGDWGRIALVIETDEAGEQTLSKYLDGEFLDSQVVDADVGDGSRWSIDADQGFLLFSEPNGFTSEIFANSFYFAEDALDEAAVEALGGVDVDGPVDAPTFAGDFQLSFDGALDAVDFGSASVAPISLGGPDNTSYLVKGSIFGNPDGEGEAALYQQSNGANEILVWEDGVDWSNYVFDMTVEPADNDTIGAVFYYRDEDNHYRLTLNQQEDTRTLAKVEDGVETVLAQETGSYRHFAMQDLRIGVLDGEITITLDDELLFGGPVTDDAPLAGGTVGMLSQFMDRVLYDNVAVNPIDLAARALASEPSGRWAADLDGDGQATVDLTAAASLSAAGITAYEWLVGDEVLATGETASLDLAPGETVVTLRVTDSAGATSEDKITVEVAGNGAILAADDFEDGDFAGWTIVDEGTLEGPSDWQVVDGELVEASNILSDQQGTGSTAFSVEGDGPFILRDGTYALWDDPAALDWTDYAFEATITPNDDDGIGLLFRYTDADNYYKLEADAQTGLVMLTRHFEGRESILARGYDSYTPGDSQHWRIEVQDGVLTPYIDGKKVFGTEIDDRNLPSGTVGLYSWGSEDLAFDDVVVAELPVSGSAVANPDAVDDELSTDADRPLSADLLANDTDPDGDSLEILTIDGAALVPGEPVALASGAVLTVAEDGAASYDPNGAFDGLKDGETATDSFAYTVSDGLATDTATVTVRIDGVNDDPAAADDDATTDENVAVTIDVLANDDDVDGDDLFVVEVGAPANGVATIEANGTVTYTPNDGFFGSDSFTYQIDDGNGGTASASVAVEVMEVQDPPTNVIVGTDDGEIIRGSDGADVIVAAGGRDTVIAEEGDDIAQGGDGDDVLFGDEGDDLLLGGDGDDLLLGGDGDNDLQGGEGDDRLVGDDGGDNDLDGDAGDDMLVGGDGNDDLHGGEGDDILVGREGDDDLDGDAGDDTLVGGAGDDTLLGGAGDDALDGGEGSDTLIGGSGVDTAVFDGDLEDFALTVNDLAGLAIVVDGSGAVDTVIDVEFLEFDDQTVAIGTAVAAEAAAAQAESDDLGMLGSPGADYDWAA